MAVATTLAVGAVAGAYGAKKKADAQKAAQRSAQDIGFRGFDITGGGGSAAYNPNSGEMNLQLNDQLSGIQQSLFGQSQNAGGLNMQALQSLMGLGAGVMGGFQTLGQPTPFSPYGFAGLAAGQQPSLPGFNPVAGPAPTAQGPGAAANLPQFQQVNPFTTGPFAPNRGSVRALNQAAMGLLPGASQDIAGAEQDALSRLRAQAAPMERQAMSDLNERLFGTGQGAVTGNAQVELGGGRLAQAFGRGLGQADLDRQVQAQNLAIQRRGADQAGVQGFFGQSGQLQGLDESLRQGLFGRQLGMGQFDLGQQGQAFNQALAGAQFGQGAGNDLFAQQLQAAQFGAGEQARGFNQALASGQFGESAMQNLFNRQLSANQFGLGANQQAFNQNLGTAGFNNTALSNLFGIGSQLFGAQQGLTQQNLQNQLGLLGAATNLYSIPQQLFALGQNAETARSNAAANKSGVMTNIASQPNPWMSFGNGLMTAGIGGGGGMSNLFGGGGGGTVPSTSPAQYNLWSDSRLKDNLTQIDTDPDTGLAIYVWQWNKEAKRLGIGRTPPIGLVAQEVQERFPEAVTERRGYLQINYRKLIELAGV